MARRQRRPLLLEGRAVMRHAAGTAPAGALRRYVRVIERDEGGSVLLTAPWGPLYRIEALASPALRRRFDIALLLAEATPAGARATLLLTPLPWWRAVVQVVAVLAVEAGWMALRPFLKRGGHG